MRTARVLCVMVGLAAPLPALGQGSIDFLNVGENSGDGLAMSANGKVFSAVGYIFRDDRPFVFGLYPGVLVLTTQGNSAAVADMSLDGRTVVGEISLPTAGTRPFRWTPETGLITLSTSPGSAVAVSGDGSVVVGNLTYSPQQPFIWTAAGGLRTPNLPLLSGPKFTAISGDGKTVFGSGQDFVGSPGPYRGFRWTEESGQQLLPLMPGLPNSWLLPRVSNSAGTIVAGDMYAGGDSFSYPQGFIWKVGQPPFPIGGTGWQKNYLDDMSEDGTIVVGWGYNGTSGAGSPNHTWVWREGQPVRSIAAYLQSRGVSVPVGLLWGHPTRVTPDGRTLLCHGGLESPLTLGPIIATTACYADCTNSTWPPLLAIDDFICFLNKYAAGDGYANCDGSTVPPVINAADFMCFQTSFAAGCP